MAVSRKWSGLCLSQADLFRAFNDLGLIEQSRDRREERCRLHYKDKDRGQLGLSLQEEGFLD
jgi:hypothetical protein